MPHAYIVTPWFGIFAGGAERAARTLAIALQRRGWEIEVLTTCSADLFGDWTEDGFPPGLDECEGLAVRRFPLDRDRIERYRAAVAEWTSGAEVSREAMYDFFSCGIGSDALVAYVGELPQEAPVIALPYFHALTYRTIVEHPGRVDLFACLHDEPQLYWEPVADMLAQARRVLFLSDEEKALAIRVFGQSHGRRLVESPVVGVGVELNAEQRALLAQPDRLREIRHKLGVPDDYFLSVGRKDRGKGLPQLVDGYEDFARGCGAGAPPLVLLGDGDADLVPRSEAFIDIGFGTEEEKLALLEGALATVNLSTNESFSLVVMESWLTGTPVIVSSECAVTSGHCARSGGGVAVSGAAELGAALEALRDRELGALAGAAGRDHVMAEYDWDAVTDRFARAVWNACES